MGIASETGWLESCVEGGRIPCVAVKCVEMWEEIPVAKAAPDKDCHASGCESVGAQTGLHTPVVHAVNDVDLEVVVLNRGFRS